jgi:hypothetical protein
MESVRSFVTLNTCVLCVVILSVCGKEMKERGQGGPSSLVLDPTARNREMQVKRKESLEHRDKLKVARRRRD